MIEERGIFYTTMWSSIRREPGRAALVTSKNADDEAVSLRFNVINASRVCCVMPRSVHAIAIERAEE